MAPNGQTQRKFKINTAQNGRPIKASQTSSSKSLTGSTTRQRIQYGSEPLPRLKPFLCVCEERSRRRWYCCVRSRLFSHSRVISFLFTIPIPSFIAQHNHFLTGKRYGRVLLQLFVDDVVCVFSISFAAQSFVIFFVFLFSTVVKYYLTICVLFFF